MSLRRFAGYFFALTVLATVAFASCLMGQASPEEAAAVIMKEDQEFEEHSPFFLQQSEKQRLHISIVRNSSSQSDH